MNCNYKFRLSTKFTPRIGGNNRQQKIKFENIALSLPVESNLPYGQKNQLR
jgi:hypothetical protein